MGTREAHEKRAEERALTMQEREMHSFYQPWLAALGSSSSVASHVQDLADCDEFDPHTLSQLGYSARASRDKALTSFAQLATLRLGVRRCMVSLLDSTHQYILAEATKTISLVDASRHAENDELWLGNAIIPRDEAVCQCVFKRRYTVKDDHGNTVTLPATVIPDCREDAEFRNKPYVVKEPGVRFYAGVPIKSRSGLLIGVYAVSSDTPRAPLTYDEVRFMQDVAMAVMEHLEWARDRVDRFKGERIVRGMADFIESSPTMRGVKDEQDKEKTEQETEQDDTRQGGKATKSTTEHQDHQTKDSSLRPPSSQPGRTSSSRPLLEARSPSFQKRVDGKPDSILRLLNRAASILRESALAEGVVFFGPSGNTPVEPTLRASMAGFEKWPSTDDESSKRLSTNSVTEGEMSTDSDIIHQSAILGISLTNKKDYSSFHNTTLGVSTLEKYFKLFPKGKSLHFSQSGSLSSGDDSASDVQTSANDRSNTDGETATEKVLTRRRKARMSHQELLKNLPGVKNVIFLPLWDYVEGKMVAGCFLWTANTGRMMNLDDDLSYLRAFGNTIMSEVARMKAMKDDRAKTTFIASMSHELRSPLHGILGSVEFLQDTASDSYQSGLINSIATCGKTLLDTLDHVLDHAKINKLGRSKMRKGARMNRFASTTDSSMESLNVVAELDLGELVEEVVEAVCAGHAFKQMHTEDLRPRGNPRLTISRASSAGTVTPSTADGENLRQGEVAVLLDVAPRVSWRTSSNPGALRRIIMNLLGNALKYTARGFVAVSLRAQENTNSNKIDVIFRVVDSGKGMSEDFQKNRLFIPFSQEDSFQPGTGLGLSIVRQIVDSLGGTIDIHSVQNVGTEVDVRLSLDAAPGGIDMPDEEITSVAAKTRGLRLCLLDPNAEKQKDKNDHIERLDTTLSEVCWGWFEMEVTKASKLDDVDADIFLYTEPPSVEFLLQHHSVNTRRPDENGNQGKEVPLIIVCLNASEAIDVAANHSKQLSNLGRIVEVIPQPCGPRKLAKVLSHCIRRIEEEFNRSIDAGKYQKSMPVRSKMEDMGMGMVMGVPSSSLPRLSSSDEKEESERTRQYLRDISTEVPPSTAVAFPIKQRLSSAEPRPLQDEPPSDESVHVCLVDDNKINRQLLVMFMKKHKLPYEEAENGQEALDKYIEFCGPDAHSQGKRRFDFVLMDISMPIMDGLEATRRIREYEREHKLERATIIALTGLASAEAQAEAESSGIDVYMAKPVKFQTLRPLLDRKKESRKSSKDSSKQVTKKEAHTDDVKSERGSNGDSTTSKELHSQADANQATQDPSDTKRDNGTGSEKAANTSKSESRNNS